MEEPVQNPENQTAPAAPVDTAADTPTEKQSFDAIIKSLEHNPLLHKKILYLIPALFVLLILLLILAPKKKPVSPPVKEIVVSPTAQPTPTPMPAFDCPAAPDSITGWQVYTNKDQYFCIKYPPGDLFKYFSSSGDSNNFTANFTENKDGSGFGLHITSKLTDQTLDNFIISTYTKLSDLTTKKSIVVNGQRGFTLSHDPVSILNGTPVPEVPTIYRYDAVFKPTARIYWISFTDEGSNTRLQNQKSLLDQIISTFNPLDFLPPPDTTSWSLYTSQTLGYSVKYNPLWSVTTDQNGTIHFYPPNSEQFLKDNRPLPTAGIRPEISIKLVNDLFGKPGGSDVRNVQAVTTNDGLSGYYYSKIANPLAPVFFDLPYGIPDQEGNRLTLRFQLTSLGRDKVDSFNQAFNAKAEDADEATLRAMLATITIVTPTLTPTPTPFF